MTVFGLGIFQGHAAWADLWRNLAWTVPGNIVGGGVLVGLAYAWVGRPASAVSVAPEPIRPAVDAPLLGTLQPAIAPRPRRPVAGAGFFVGSATAGVVQPTKND